MSEPVRFLLNGPVETEALAPPDLTLLQWLRVERRLTGTKEGCAEGDCGACTVVLGEADGDRLRWRPVNACILLMGQVHGRLVVTVEGLAEGDALHPVQAAMVARHASQCGFCTPGFVMSLFAAFKTDAEPDDSRVHDALAGNLCRCTGYRPIVDAARDALAAPRTDAYAAMEADLAARLRAIMAAPAHERRVGHGVFRTPRSRAELAAVLRDAPGARIVAGGTDLALDVTKRHLPQSDLVWIGAIEDLRRIDLRDAEIVVGAATSYADLMPALAQLDPSVDVLLRRLGSRQIRSLGTIGGNLANASPIGDTPPLLLALGARVTIGSADGERELPLDEFFTGYRRTALRPGEFIDRVTIPRPGPGAFLRVDKISRRFDQDISAVCGAIHLVHAAGRIVSARVAFGGMAATPARAPAAEAALVGAPLTEETFLRAGAALAQDFAPIDDFRASADYRLRAAQNLFRRWFAVLQGAEAEAAE
ncbi:MAG TPA: xanthine dehydrogenase small subunit [Beijerinckiaceae bacterium]